MSISSAGLGSGLDVENIIASLIAVESQPVVSLQQRKTELDVKISAFGQMKSQLDAFQAQAEKLSDAALFSKVSVTSSNTDIVTVSASDSQAVGNYAVDVVRLAQAQSLDSVAFTDADSIVGEGDLTISAGDKTFTLTVNSDNNTLAALRDSINAANDNDFMSASIINTDAGSRLVLTSAQTGAANQLSVTVANDNDGNNDDGNGLSVFVYQATGTQNLNETQAAEDSEITINGYTVTSDSNSVSNVVDGLTFNLVSVGEATVTSRKDTATLESELNALVNIYNVTLAQNNQFKSETLSGDNFILSIERSLRNVINQSYLNQDSPFNYVFEIGLTFNKEGVLSVDSERFAEALASNPSAVQALLTDSDNGFAKNLENTLAGFTASSGMIDNKTETYTQQIASIDDRILNINYRLNLTETRLRAQFTSLDTFIGSSIQTSSFLATNLSNFNLNTNSSDN